MKIILVRHAETIKNKLLIVQGHSDSDLTEEGFAQLERTRKYLRKQHIDVIFCSSLGRARKTAVYIAEPHHIKPVPDDRLKELDWGEFSKFLASELLQKWSKYYEEQKKKGVLREIIRPPKGENSFDHMKRIKSFLDMVIKKYGGKTIMIVGHGGTNKVIIGILKKIDPEKFFTVKQDNACINILELNKKGKLTKAEINITKHLGKKVYEE